jgi:hypothetical protein
VQERLKIKRKPKRQKKRMTQQQKIRDTSTTEGIDSQGKDF